MGYISDNTRTRWGRRRPYIFIGAIAAGLIFALLWQLPADRSEAFYFWYFLTGSLLFYLAYTVFATPWVALGYELTPDYHERTRLGKRRTFFLATGISMVGYALKWVCYNPEVPWLLLVPAPLMAFGLGALFTLMPSMIADVVDADELNTHERREGMYGSIFWWVVKLGMAAALAAGGFLLNATGFDVALGGDQAGRTIYLMRLFDAFIPCIASGIAIWAIFTFPITEEKAHEVRLELERRRGAPGAAVPHPA